MPTELGPRHAEAARLPTSHWLLLVLLLFYIASFLMMLIGLTASIDTVQLASP